MDVSPHLKIRTPLPDMAADRVDAADLTALTGSDHLSVDRDSCAETTNSQYGGDRGE